MKLEAKITSIPPGVLLYIPSIMSCGRLSLFDHTLTLRFSGEDNEQKFVPLHFTLRNIYKLDENVNATVVH